MLARVQVCKPYSSDEPLWELGILFVPAQSDALKFLFLAVQAAGYTVHAEFVLSHTNGTARRGARAFCVACRRRMCYADMYYHKASPSKNIILFLAKTVNVCVCMFRSY